jgi:LAGLIDADG-like domain
VLTEDFLRQRYLEERQYAVSIGSELGIDAATERNFMKRFNILLRTSSESRRPSVDSSGFHMLSTDWHAYWTGFLAADGCVYINEKKDEQRVQLILHIADADHLRNLQQGLKTAIPVYLRPHGQRLIARIVIHDSNLVNALAHWGIVPNKSLIMSWPTHLPSTAILAYIRGYFDGDGTVFHRHWTSQNRSWTETVYRFISGSVPFLEGLQQELNKRGIQTHAIYRNQEANAFFLPSSSRRENLLTFSRLLDEGSTVYLEHKRNIFREMERISGIK